MSIEVPVPNDPQGPILLSESDAPERPISPPARRVLYPSLLINQLVLVGTIVAFNAIVLPIQVMIISHGDPVLKVNNLAVITAAATIAQLLVQPIIGAISDRTRSRFGRRTPYLVIGAAILGAACVGMGQLTSIPLLALAYSLIQIGLNMIQGPLSAVAPDRVPVKRRGMISAFIGMGAGLGGTLGITLASKLLPNMTATYTTFGALVLVVTLAFVLLNRDHSSREMVNPPFSWGRFLGGFWINPRKHPDFAWALALRSVYYIGYQVISAYQFYILTDYIKLPPQVAQSDSALLALAFMISSVVLLPIAGFLSDRIGRRKPFILIAVALMVIGAIFPLVSPSFESMLILQTFFGASFGFFASCDFALMTEVLPGGGKAAAKDLGILNLGTQVPVVLSTVIGAVIINHFGGYPALFGFGIVVVALSALTVIPIKSVR